MHVMVFLVAAAARARFFELDERVPFLEQPQVDNLL
jgi:hypothetical protein